jgi:hypothetical protein
MNLFETKVKYVKIDENGKAKVVSENYLLDAVSFGDAEESIHEEMEQCITGEFNVVAIKLSNINEVITGDPGETFYKGKITFSDDGKKSSMYILVNAESIETAYTNIDDVLSGVGSDYVITGIVDSKLIEYFNL